MLVWTLLFSASLLARRIDFRSHWTGDYLTLATRNEPIDIAKPINALFVILDTSNAMIRIREDVKLSVAITMTTTNNDIITDKSIDAATVISSSTNGHLSHNIIIANRSEIKTTSGIVEINHGYIDEVSNIQTTNAKLNVNLDYCSHCVIFATSVNSDVVLTMVWIFFFQNVLVPDSFFNSPRILKVNSWLKQAHRIR
jgi:hypothetical protein